MAETSLLRGSVGKNVLSNKKVRSDGATNTVGIPNFDVFSNYTRFE